MVFRNDTVNVNKRKGIVERWPANCNKCNGICVAYLFYIYVTSVGARKTSAQYSEAFLLSTLFWHHSFRLEPNLREL